MSDGGTLTLAIKGEYKRIYECYIFKYVSYLHKQDIQYDFITLYKVLLKYCLEQESSTQTKQLGV